MVQIVLTDREVQMLQEILESYLSDLRMEIANTDRMDFREQLKTKEVFIKDLQQRLERRS